MFSRLRMVLFWVVAGVCAYFAYLYFAGSSDDGAGFFDWDNDGPRLVHALILLAVLLPALFAMRPKMSEVAQGVLLWGGIAAVLATGYAYRHDLERAAAPVLSGLVPGMAFETGSNEIVLTRSQDGHFRARATINGADARVMVDTGASLVALTHETAIRAGYDPDNLAFTVPVSTANGIAMASPVRLESLAIGPLAYRDVPALIAEPGRLSSNLLGMSYLERLSEYGVRGDRMTMTR